MTMTMLPIAMLLDVMDKQVTVQAFWIGGTVLGAIGVAAARWRRWAALPAIAIIAIMAWWVWAEWTDRFVGPAMQEEAGRLYPFHLALAPLLATALIFAGLAWRRRRAHDRSR